MRKILTGIALLAAVACAPRLGSVPIVDPTSAATFVIIYLGGSSDQVRTLILNGQAVATLPAGSYTEIPVQPGPHRLGVGWTVVGGLAWTVHEQMVVAEPRTTYYFVITGPSTQARMRALSAEEARAALLQSTYRPTGEPVK